MCPDLCESVLTEFDCLCLNEFEHSTSVALGLSVYQYYLQDVNHWEIGALLGSSASQDVGFIGSLGLKLPQAAFKGSVRVPSMGASVSSHQVAEGPVLGPGYPGCQMSLVAFCRSEK